jgi:hypothetical protein
MIFEKIVFSVFFLSINLFFFLILPNGVMDSKRKAMVLGGVSTIFYSLIKLEIIFFHSLTIEIFDQLLFFSLGIPFFLVISKLQYYIFENRLNEKLRTSYLKAKPLINLIVFKFIYVMVYVYQLFIIWNESATLRSLEKLPY